jgi:hypothetical protein
MLISGLRSYERLTRNLSEKKNIFIITKKIFRDSFMKDFVPDNLGPKIKIERNG